MSCKTIMLSQLHTQLGRRKEDHTEITPELLELWLKTFAYLRKGRINYNLVELLVIRIATFRIEGIIQRINKSTHIEQLHRCLLFVGHNLEEPLTTLNLHFIFPLFSKCQIFTDLSSLVSVLKFGGKYVKNLQRCP